MSDAAETRQDAPWIAALRVMDYRLAAAEFDRVEPKPTNPAHAFARAVIAFELADHARLDSLCQGRLEAKPEHASGIERMCALSRLEVDPSVPRAEALAEGSRFDDALHGIEVLVELEAFDAARRHTDRWLDKSDGAGARTARLRRLSAELWERQGQLGKAAQDYRTLALSFPTRAAAAGADLEYERLSKRRLDKAQRYARAEAFTKEGQLDAALHELEALSKAPGAGISKVELLRTRAWAHYKARSGYATASELFTQSAKLDKRFRTQDMFYAARALSRAQRDEEAIERYTEITRTRPEGRYTEEARFLIGRLHFVLGHWDAAVKAHEVYFKRHGRSGRFSDSARYEVAVANLGRGRGDLAEKPLREIIDQTRSARARALLEELLGVALMQQGKVSEATAQFQKVIVERPLSFAALMSAQRLAQLGLPPPPVVGRADKEPAPKPLDVKLPPDAEFYTRLGLDEMAESALANSAKRFRERYAPRGGEALCVAYGKLAVARQRYRHAQRVVRERALLREITPATRWIWDCIYPTPYASAVKTAQETHGVPAGLVHAVMRQESAFAPRVGSPAGAQGLMQLMPATAKSAARELDWELTQLDVHVPAQNIELGTFYLGKLLRKFHGSVPLAAAGYNAGPAAASRWLAAAGDLPMDLFVAFIPYKETRGYVQRVFGNWARYRFAEGGEGALPVVSLELPPSVESKPGEY